MPPRTLLLLAALLCAGLAACADNNQDRGPFHSYLHDHGLE
ncbi:MAG: hypothetical protein ACRYG6_06365 [Janthinobacterium lividum]